MPTPTIDDSVSPPIAASPPVSPAETSLFGPLGAWSARRKYLVIAAWIGILIAATFGSAALNGSFDATLRVPNSAAQTGADLIDAHTPADPVTAAGASGTVVFHVQSETLTADEPAIQQAIATMRDLPGVFSISDPLDAVSADARVAVAEVQYDEAKHELDSADVAAIDAAVSEVRAAGVSVDYGGELGEAAGASGAEGLSELIGIGVALLLLLLIFGSVFAALIPVVSAALGVFAGLGVLGMVSAAAAFPDESPTLAVMIGLGVGIDYALFLGTRFRQHIIDGHSSEQAAALTVASSGRAVVIAAITVVVSMAGLAASGIVYIGQLGISASITVAVAALAAITLVPAILAVAGRRIDVAKIRRHPVAEPVSETSAWHRYAAQLGKHPAAFLAIAIVLLGVLALPALTLRIGEPGVTAAPTDSTERRASEAIDRGFGNGFQTPVTVVIALPPAVSDTELADIAEHATTALEDTTGLASVTGFGPTDDRALLIGQATPTTNAQDDRTAALIERLQTGILPAALAGTGAAAYVTGETAVTLALDAAIGSSLVPIIITVIVAAMILMLLTFRAPLLALMAGATTLLSIGAAYGLTVAVFQWGWGSQLIGMPEDVPIISYVPTLLFAIIFGLSMDYEVFLLSRIREARMRGASNADSVATGITGTGRIIACAALIMACVFFSFLISDNPAIKMLALGLGASILIDAFIVRLVIVPSAMYLLGRHNWSTPRWLDKALPRLEH